VKVPKMAEHIVEVTRKLDDVVAAVGTVTNGLVSQNNQLSGISAKMTSQTVSGIVPIFDGKPNEFRDWTRSIEKHIFISGLPANDAKSIAYQRSKGLVSDFIGRQIQVHLSWADLKRQLAARFGEVSDPHCAFALLQKCRQKKEENVGLFAERLFSLAEEAFPDGMSPAVHRQLIGFFVDGLSSQAVAMKVLRGNPATFEAAVTTADTEATFQKQFALRLGTHKNRYNIAPPQTHREFHDGVEPMEIDHSRGRGCYKCGRGGHSAQQCRVRLVHEVTRICWVCGEQGHIRRDCPMKGKGRSLNGNRRY